LAIHFTPYYTNADDETFLLRAWQDSVGLPGTELGENYQFHTPQYFTDGFDIFAYYPYDDPIPVNGNIHVGIVQGSEAMLNFGLDKNTNANAGQLHYQLGLGGVWLNSDTEGTVMIRPVLRANKQDSWIEVAELSPGNSLLSCYPNPVSQGVLYVNVALATNWTVYDATGRIVSEGNWAQAGQYTLDSRLWTAGHYILQIGTGESQHIIVQ